MSVNKSTSARPQQALKQSRPLADAKKKSAETQKAPSRRDAFPKIEDAFDDESTSSSRSMPAFKQDAPIPNADPKAQSQFREMLTSARLGSGKGVIGAGKNLLGAAQSNLSSAGSAGSQVAAGFNALSGSGDVVAKGRAASNGATALASLGNMAAGFLKDAGEPGLASKLEAFSGIVGKGAGLASNATGVAEGISGGIDGIDKLANGEGSLERAGGAAEAGAGAANALENLAGLLQSSNHPDMKRLGETMGKRAAQIKSGANRTGNVLGAAEAAQNAISVFNDPDASVMDKIGATAQVATRSATLAGDLAEIADGRGKGNTAQRLRTTQDALGGAKRGARIAGSVATVLDDDKSVLERAGAGANVIAEGAQAVESGAKGIAGRTKNEGIKTRATRVADGASSTSRRATKAAGGIGKGAGIAGAYSTLTDENASTTAKIEAGATGAKVAGEVLQSGAEFVAKRATKSGSKAIAKTAAKTIAKSIPFIGIAADVAATADSAREAYKTFNDPKASTGDEVVAGLHTVTQAVGVIPVVGDAVSLVGDLGKAAWGWFSD